MTGRKGSIHARFYRTITEAEFARIFGFVVESDGKRPWEADPPQDPEEGT